MLDLAAYAFPVVMIVGGLVFFHLRRKHLVETFETLARRHGGTLGRSPWGIYPRIAVPLEGGGEVHVSGIQGSRNGRVTSTFAWIGSDDYPHLNLDTYRKPARMGLLEAVGQTDANTGDPTFDAAFWMQADDGKAVRKFLDEELRSALLAFDRTMRVRLRIGTLLTFPEGWRTGQMRPSLEVTIQRLPPEVEDVERMLDLAKLVHAKLLRARQAQAA